MTNSDAVGVFTARDGLNIAFSRWPGPDQSPLAVMVHATGFCKELCGPVVEDLNSLGVLFRALAIDQRGHGDSESVDPPADWWDVGRDIVELVENEREPRVGVGHSAGGTALLLAELARPGTFSELVLVEPIVFPPPYGRFPDNPMASAARRRRDRFASRQAAFDNWMSKPAFSGWEERAMTAYVDGGLRDDGEEVVLKCSKESEAEFFTAATTHQAWDRLGEIRSRVTMIAGEHSTTHREPMLGELVSRLPDATSIVVPKASHFVWMERPKLVADVVAEVIGRLR